MSHRSKSTNAEICPMRKLPPRRRSNVSQTATPTMKGMAASESTRAVLRMTGRVPRSGMSSAVKGLSTSTRASVLSQRIRRGYPLRRMRPLMKVREYAA